MRYVEMVRAMQSRRSMITITREKKFNRQGWKWTYALVGPDGYHSNGKNLPALRQMAERRYPSEDITEEWSPNTEPNLTQRMRFLLELCKCPNPECTDGAIDRGEHSYQCQWCVEREAIMRETT